MSDDLLEPKRRKRARNYPASTAFYCSWGRHRTYKCHDVKEEYPHGTICLTCQVEIMGNLEHAVFMPQLSEAMQVVARKRWEAQREQHLAAKPLRHKAPDTDGLVYYLRINGRVKIGYTTDLNRRSRAYPPGSELLAVEPGTRETESHRHRQFSRDLAQGREWFFESDAISTHVAALVAEFGKPDALMHRFKAHSAARKVNASG